MGNILDSDSKFSTYFQRWGEKSLIKFTRHIKDIKLKIDTYYI